MTKPGDEVTGKSDTDEEPRLDKETLEDLDASDAQEQEVKGGETTKGQVCEAGTA